MNATRLLLDLPPLTILLYPATARAILIGPGGMRVLPLSFGELCRAARQAKAERRTSHEP
jgi:hypothetical protein